MKSCCFEVVKLKSIYIYPIKGLGGIALNEAVVLQKGLQYDRRMMLVDEQGVFISQRTFPNLSLFKLQSLSDGFSILFGEQQIKIPFSFEGELLPVRVWEDEVQAIVAPHEINAWFSQQLNQSIRLVYMPEYATRAVDKKYALQNEQVSFADGYPILVISEASLQLLNSKLEESVLMDRFRPNLVLTDCEAHAEDELKIFAIGEVEFKGVKPCARCTVVTINQQNAQQGSEPLKTLSTYRKMNNKVLFGQNVLCLQQGKIKVNQIVETTLSHDESSTAIN